VLWIGKADLDFAGRLPGKARHLDKLAREGLPVPEGFLVTRNELDAPATAAGVRELLRGGSIIVRSAASNEDDRQHSEAGLWDSIPDCTTVGMVFDAAGRIWHSERSTRVEPEWLIIQRQIPWCVLVVAAFEPGSDAYIEAHDLRMASEQDRAPLATGTDPTFAGPVSVWPSAAADAIQAVCERAHACLGELALDIELAVTLDGHVWLVQARPLVEPVCPGWPAFLAEVTREGRALKLEQLLRLDAEHNPAPLSFAHASLMDTLAAQRTGVGEPTVLAGFLYVRSLPRDVFAHGEHRSKSDHPQHPERLRATLRRLRHELIPQARTKLSLLDSQLIDAELDRLPGLLDQALGLFFAMIDAYVSELGPVRPLARTALTRAIARASRVGSPVCLLDRTDYLDVLPVVWDIASPYLAERIDGSVANPCLMDSMDVAREHDQCSEDIERVAIMLAELDDHLFALGMAPVRAVYLATASRLGLSESDVFLLGIDELRDHLVRTSMPEHTFLRERRELAARRERLDPPLWIHAGRALPPLARAELCGIPIGSSFDGTVHPRRDLDDVIARPVPSDGILTVPTLTAQAAVVLANMGVKAVCCEYGGALSHAALMARELGLSALIGCKGCTSVPERVRARVDTRLGRLRLARHDHGSILAATDLHRADS